MQEEVLEVISERPQDAMEEVVSLAGVKEAALFGRGLHVVVRQSADASLADRIRTRLAACGFAVERVGKIVPSLEDVFVSLIEVHDRAAAPQAAVQG